MHRPSIPIPNTRAALSRRRSIPWAWWRPLGPTSRPSGCMADTHECDDQTIGRTRIISNQLGYPGNLGGFECKDFDEAGLAVEVDVYHRAGKEITLRRQTTC